MSKIPLDDIVFHAQSHISVRFIAEEYEKMSPHGHPFFELLFIKKVRDIIALDPVKSRRRQVIYS
jgi:hypothetical protein